jgi:hypothetical protein
MNYGLKYGDGGGLPIVGGDLPHIMPKDPPQEPFISDQGTIVEAIGQATAGDYDATVVYGEPKPVILAQDIFDLSDPLLKLEQPRR